MISGVKVLPRAASMLAGDPEEQGLGVEHQAVEVEGDGEDRRRAHDPTAGFSATA